MHVITVTFFYVFLRFFENPKKPDFLRFLPCFTRFLELWAYGNLNSKYILHLFTMSPLDVQNNFVGTWKTHRDEV